MAKVIVGCAHGEEDPDGVIVSYLTAGAALDKGHEVVMWLTSDGVRLALRGYADRIRADKEPPVSRVHAQFIEKGGTLLRLPGLLQRACARRLRARSGCGTAGCHATDGVRRRLRDDVHLLTVS